MLRVSFAAVILALPAQAQDSEELTISSFRSPAEGYLEINLQDTVAGREVICNVYDRAGTLLTSGSQRTDDLTTQVLIAYDAFDAVSARCVYRD